MLLTSIFSLLCISLIFLSFIPGHNVKLIRSVSLFSSAIVLFLSCGLLVQFDCNTHYFQNNNGASGRRPINSSSPPCSYLQAVLMINYVLDGMLLGALRHVLCASGHWDFTGNTLRCMLGPFTYYLHEIDYKTQTIYPNYASVNWPSITGFCGFVCTQLHHHVYRRFRLGWHLGADDG